MVSYIHWLPIVRPTLLSWGKLLDNGYILLDFNY